MWLLPGCQVVLRYSSSRRVRSYMCQASRCGASSSRAVMAFLASGPDQSQGLRLVRCCEMVFPKPICDRLLHKSSENSPLSASARTPSANSVPDSASGMDDQLPLVSFLLLSATPARAAPVDSSASIGRTSGPLAPSGLPRIPLETSPDVWGHPRRKGSNHSISPRADTIFYGFGDACLSRAMTAIRRSWKLRKRRRLQPNPLESLE